MLALTSPQNVAIPLAVFASILYILYRLALPKPIPGIPYNKHAAQRILGDAPDALAWRAKYGTSFEYVPEIARRLNEPIFQVFMQPLGKPWVIVVDPYEAHDIRTRRAQEFDRSIFFEQVFGLMMPEFHLHMPTGDKWKAHRKLISETMSTKFLHDVAAPHMWKSILSVLELWKTKARMAERRPWSASEDVYKGALDIIWAATFGSEMGSARSQNHFLVERLQRLDLPESVDEAVKFPTTKDPEDFTALLTLSESADHAIQGLWPKFSHWIALNLISENRRAVRHKNKLITEKLRASEGKLSESSALDGAAKQYRSALDLVVTREIEMANRDGRAPIINSQTMRDELFGFMIAGHDTSSTFVCWTFKYLTDYQLIQQKLHAALREAFSDKSDSVDKYVPSVTDITSTSIPYLDAVMEETGRCGLTVAQTIRVTKRDVEILGHIVPKGTDVILPVNGPGFVGPLVGNIQDHQRSKTSLAQKEKWGTWDPEDIATYKPERWLKQDNDGNEYCDRDAGPANAFGSGPRACFGKKWAMLEIKIMLVLVVWHFELQPTPPDLSSHVAIDGITHRPKETYVRLKERIL